MTQVKGLKEYWMYSLVCFYILNLYAIHLTELQRLCIIAEESKLISNLPDLK